MRKQAVFAIKFGAVVLLSMAALPNWVHGQAPQGAAANPSFGPLVVKSLKGGVYWTQGGTGGNNCNTGFIVGDTGVIVVDAKLNHESAQAMLAEIAKITPKPVTHVILTHSDGDHINGLPAFPKGITIIAHQNAEKEMEAAIQAGGRGAPAREYMPTQVVTKDNEVLTIDGVRLNLIHVAPAHTSGDLAVFLPDQKILFTGDVMATTRPEPLVHREKGGTSGGFVDFYRVFIALDVETFVTGHGEIVAKPDLQKRMTEVQEKQAKISAMVGHDQSLEDIKAAFGEGTSATMPPGGRGPAIASLTEIIYAEVKNQ
jgi:cyclase